MGALALLHDGGLIPRDVFVTPQLFEVRREIILPDTSIVLHKPEDFAAMMPVRERDFEAWLHALEIGDERAIAWFRTYVLRRRNAAASPFTETKNVSGTYTALTGYTGAILKSYGAGGGGGWRSSATAGGGAGGGAFCQNTCVIAAGDAITSTVGAYGPQATIVGNNGTAGGATTSSGGTGGFTGVAHNAGGGGAGQNSSTAGIAGVASGGTINTNGNPGDAGLSGGGGGAGANGGAGGAGGVGGAAVAGTTPGGGGGSANNAGTPADGGNGRSTIDWS